MMRAPLQVVVHTELAGLQAHFERSQLLEEFGGIAVASTSAGVDHGVHNATYAGTATSPMAALSSSSRRHPDTREGGAS